MVFSLATNVLKTRAPVVGRRFLAGGPGPTQSPLVPQAIKDQQAHFQQNPHLHGGDDPTFGKTGQGFAFVVFGGALLGLAGVVRGGVNMSLGINKD